MNSVVVGRTCHPALAEELAAGLRAAGHGTVVVLDPPGSGDCRPGPGGTRAPAGAGELRAVLERTRAEELWWLDAAPGGRPVASGPEGPEPDGRGPDTAAAPDTATALDTALTVGGELGLGRARFVALPHGTGRAGGLAAQRAFVTRCLALGLAWQVLRIRGAGPPPAAPGAVGPDLPCPDLLGLVERLHGWHAEFEDRCPGLLAKRPIRVVPPRHLATEPGPAALAESLLRLSRAGRDGGFLDADAAALRRTALLEAVGDVHGLRLVPAGGPDELDPLERSLHRRLTVPPGPAAEQRPSRAPAAATGTPSGLLPLLRETRRAHDRAVERARTSAAALASRLRTRTLDVRGAPLRVRHAGAAGPVVVLANALGQGWPVWSRLADRLLAGHRVLTWDVRGTDAADPEAGLPGQVDDLAAAVREARALFGEGAPVHLVSWCTAAKVATAFEAAHPGSIASHVFLNPSFRLADRGHDLDTGFERELDTVCRTLARRPERADRLARLFLPPRRSSAPDAPEGPDQASGAGAGGDPTAEEALSAVAPALRDAVRRPFQDGPTLLRYAFQLMDFWAYDSARDAGRVLAPVLVVTADRDDVASPRRAHAAAADYPHARRVELLDATHYGMYDRAGLVARLVADFVRRPCGAPLRRGDLRWH